MHTPTLVMATVALLSSAVAAQDRPKFFFPRQVKREISNNSGNGHSHFGSSSSSTKRDLIGDLFGVLTGNGSPEPTPTPSAEVVKTVIVSNTVVVGNGVTTTLGQGPATTAPTDSAGSTGGPPLGIVLPTISLGGGLGSILPSILSPSSTGDDSGILPSGILGGSSGILGTGTGGLLPTPTSDTTSGLTYSGAGSGTGVTTSTDGPPAYNTLGPSDIISSIIGGLTGTGTDTGTAPPTGTPTPTGSGVGTGTGATTSFEPSSTAGSASASSTGLDSMISSIISSGAGGFPTGTGSNSTSQRVPVLPTSDVSSYRGNGTAIGLPPTVTKKPITPTDGATSSGAFVATSSDWVGSSILVQPSPTGTKVSATNSVSSGIPTTLPQVVAPLTGVPSAPVGYTLIQIGFTYALNYEFVVANPMSSAQIFTYLPKGIAYGLQIPESSVIMSSLEPYDTSASLGYITTLALAYIPNNVVSNLGIMIHVPVSRLYNNPSPPVFTIMSNINPSIPITVGSGLDGSGTGSSANGGSSSSTPGSGNGNGNGNGNGGIFDTNQDTQTPGAKGMTAGIATGAVVAAAAYGAAMFFIARRYKRRKLSHRRSRSLMNPAEMMQTSGSPALSGGALMSGGRQSTGSGSGSGSGQSGLSAGTGSGSNDRHSRGSGKSVGNSARTAQISGPMMAENSLGWN